MRKYDNYDFSRYDNLWEHSDILDTDLEKVEFDKNFNHKEISYNSILDDEPTYYSLMNFPEEEQDQLYAYDEELDDNVDTGSHHDDDTFENRDSYRDTDRDNVYYLI